MKTRRGKQLPDLAGTPEGSPDSGEPVFLVVGKLRRSHGIKGEVQMEIITDFPERLEPGKEFYYGDNHAPIKLISRRPHNKLMLMTFEGFDDPESVGQLTNKLLYIKRNTLPPLPEGEYYHYQLIGLKVITEGGDVLGILKDVLETGANDVYVVATPDGKEILLPVREDVILKVELGKQELVARPPEWFD